MDKTEIRGLRGRQGLVTLVCTVWGIPLATLCMTVFGLRHNGHFSEAGIG